MSGTLKGCGELIKSMIPVLALLLIPIPGNSEDNLAESERNRGFFPLKTLALNSPDDAVEVGLEDMYSSSYCFKDLLIEERYVTIIDCFLPPSILDLEGTFYDFKRSRTGKPVYMDKENFTEIVDRFVRSDWNPLVKFGGFYRSPKKLYTGSIMIPSISSTSAMAEFNEPECEENFWLVHYQGKISHRENITFRFRGMGDDILIVRVGDEIVLAACSPHSGALKEDEISDLWKSSSRESRKYRMGSGNAEVGDWIKLRAGQEVDMEVIVGHISGYHFGAMLAVEVEGTEYPEGKKGNPVLPMFKVFKPDEKLLERIGEYLKPDQISLTNGPVFNDSYWY